MARPIEPDDDPTPVACLACGGSGKLTLDAQARVLGAGTYRIVVCHWCAQTGVMTYEQVKRFALARRSVSISKSWPKLLKQQ